MGLVMVTVSLAFLLDARLTGRWQDLGYKRKILAWLLVGVVVCFFTLPLYQFL